MVLPVVILAGGLATRLRPITEKIPKALVPIAGHPFLYHQIQLLKQYHITRLILCVGYLGEMIQQQFGDGSAYGVQIQYSFDGPKLLGTGGAIRKALPMIQSDFFMLYGDSYLPINYSTVQTAFYISGQPALMTVYANANQLEPSNLWYQDGQIRAYNKKNRLPQMQHIDYGLSVFRPAIFENLPQHTPIDLADIFHQLVINQQLAAYETTQRFYEIGTPTGLKELNDLLEKQTQ